jgi:flagella basal body P-ring formation protein FlgA
MISNEEIRLKDLVESYEGCSSDLLKIQNIVIERLPYQRRMMNIQSNNIVQKVRLYSPCVTVNIPSVIVSVRWAEVTLDNERLQREASEFLTRHYNLGDSAEISFMNVPRVTIPSENVILSFEMSRTTENTNFIRLDGRIFHEGEIINSFNLTTRVQERRYVLQANRSIRRGQAISPNDFIRVSIAVNPNNAFVMNLDNDDLIANNFISKGSYLRNSDIVGSPFVQANDLVTVLIQSAAMQLSYQAVSRANGWLGDRIMLQNPDSRQTFYAQVVDRNTVLINLED